MEFTISTKVALELFDAASKVIAKKNAMPILDNMLVRVTGNRIGVTASDGECFLNLCGDLVSASEDAEFCVLPSQLIGSIKSLGEQPLTFTKNGAELRISHANGSFSVMTMDTDTYPTPLPISEFTTVAMSSDSVLKGMKDCIFATANDEVRLVMTGVHLGVNDGCADFAGTDGRVVSRSKFKGIDGNAAFIIPKKVCAILKTLLTKGYEVVFKAGTQSVHMECNGMTLDFRAIEGRFPAYNTVFPVAEPKRCIVDRGSLNGALKRVGVFCNQSSGLVKLSFSNGRLDVSGQDLDYATSATENVTCGYDAKPMEIGLNVDKMLEVIGICESENVIIDLYEPNRPVCVRPMENAENTELDLLLMPMMLQS